MITSVDVVILRVLGFAPHPIFCVSQPAATGEVVTMTGMTIVRIVEGRITDSWVKNDVMGLMNQLGAGSASR